jgi:hypothetical protein
LLADFDYFLIQLWGHSHKTSLGLSSNTLQI